MTKDKQIRDFASEMKGAFSTEKKWRRFMKKWYAAEYRSELDYAEHTLSRRACPLMASGRVHYADDDYEAYTEYGFLVNYKGEPLNGIEYTDEDIREFIRDNMVLRIHSPYDCSGEMFTMWVDWHRNPSGLISYRHRVGLDV
jgi:hypothetical protein